MILAIETTALCIVFFLSCFLGTGTDEKNLKNYSSYPDEVQNLINEIAEYRGRYKEHSKAAVFLLNFLLFLFFLINRSIPHYSSLLSTLFFNIFTPPLPHSPPGSSATH